VEQIANSENEQLLGLLRIRTQAKSA